MVQSEWHFPKRQGSQSGCQAENVLESTVQSSIVLPCFVFHVVYGAESCWVVWTSLCSKAGFRLTAIPLLLLSKLRVQACIITSRC